RAGAGCDDVLHPLSVRAVGEEEEVDVAPPEHVDRRLIRPSGLAAPVRQDAEARQLPGHAPRNGIDVARGNVPEAPHAGAPSCVGSLHPSVRYSRRLAGRMTFSAPCRLDERFYEAVLSDETAPG